MNIKDGDIFRWRYKDEKPEQLGAYGRYHCKSQIAIARTGIMADTFWMLGTNFGSDCAQWTYAEAEKRLDLKHIGNLNELEKHPEYEAAYYADADCLDLNHPNSSKGNFYVRKGAQRSREKMIAIATEKVETATRDMESASRAFKRHCETLAALADGKALDDISL